MIRTISQPIEVRGTGLHSGHEVAVTLLPRSEPGIYFSRADRPGLPDIPASIDYAPPSKRLTALVNCGASVSTVEHLLATCFAFGINALRIEVNGPELPIGDGSALIWCDAIQGNLHDIIVPLPAPPTISAVSMADGARRIEIAPAGAWSVHFFGIFPGGTPLSVQWTQQSDFAYDFAGARTFSPLSEILSLRGAGLIRGGTLENSLICVDVDITEDLGRALSEYWPGVELEVTDEDLLGSQRFRWPDEQARHKIVDVLGDLVLAGPLPPCRVKVVQGGHALTRRAVRELVRERRARLAEDSQEDTWHRKASEV